MLKERKIKGYISALYQRCEDKIKLEHLLLIVGFVIAILPILGGGAFLGDDHVYHLARLDSLKENFVNGDFITKIHGKMADTYGYGTGFFYSDFFLIIPACLYYLGMPFEMTYKLLILCIITAMMFVSYYTAHKFLKDKVIAALAAVLLTNSHYVILNVHGRTALGEAIGYIFLILIAAGLYNMVYEHFSQPYLLIAGFAGVVLSHTITTVFALIIAVITGIIHIKKLLNEKLISRIIFSAMITLLLTAFYWMPMLEQMAVQKYYYTRPWTYVYNNVTDILKLLGNGKYDMGAFMSLILIIGLIAAYEIKEIRKYIVTAFAVIFIIGSKSFWIFTGSVLNIVQFPWRLIGIAVFALVISLGIIIKKVSGNIPIIIMAAILIAFNFYCNMDFYARDAQRRSISELEIYGVQGELGGGKEWMPLAENEKYARVHPNEAVSLNGEIIGGHKKGLTFSFDYYQSNSSSNTFEIPYIYYKGYGAEINNNNIVTDIPVTKSPNGLVKIEIPQNCTSGTVTVKYKVTPLTVISRLISLGMLITCIAFAITDKRKNIK